MRATTRPMGRIEAPTWPALKEVRRAADVVLSLLATRIDMAVWTKFASLCNPALDPPRQIAVGPSEPACFPAYLRGKTHSRELLGETGSPR